MHIQNRNSTFAKALLDFFPASNGVEIEQKILEKGHTQLELDSVQLYREVIGEHPYLCTSTVAYVEKIQSACSVPSAISARPLLPGLHNHFQPVIHSSWQKGRRLFGDEPEVYPIHSWSEHIIWIEPWRWALPDPSKGSKLTKWRAREPNASL